MNRFMQFCFDERRRQCATLRKFMQSVLNYMLLVIVGHTRNKCLVLHKMAIFSRDAMRGREEKKRKNDAGVRISTLVECVFRLLYKYL